MLDRGPPLVMFGEKAHANYSSITTGKLYIYKHIHSGKCCTILYNHIKPTLFRVPFPGFLSATMASLVLPFISMQNINKNTSIYQMTTEPS